MLERGTPSNIIKYIIMKLCAKNGTFIRPVTIISVSHLTFISLSHCFFVVVFFSRFCSLFAKGAATNTKAK